MISTQGKQQYTFYMYGQKFSIVIFVTNVYCPLLMDHMVLLYTDKYHFCFCKFLQVFFAKFNPRVSVRVKFNPNPNPMVRFLFFLRVKL